MNRTRIGVLLSGSGRSLQNLLDRSVDGRLHADVTSQLTAEVELPDGVHTLPMPAVRGLATDPDPVVRQGAGEHSLVRTGDVADPAHSRVLRSPEPGCDGCADVRCGCRPLPHHHPDPVEERPLEGAWADRRQVEVRVRVHERGRQQDLTVVDRSVRRALERVPLDIVECTGREDAIPLHGDCARPRRDACRIADRGSDVQHRLGGVHARRASSALRRNGSAA